VFALLHRDVHHVTTMFIAPGAREKTTSAGPHNQQTRRVRHRNTAAPPRMRAHHPLACFHSLAAARTHVRAPAPATAAQGRGETQQAKEASERVDDMMKMVAELKAAPAAAGKPANEANEL
jgi:hypothetical protein